MSEGVSCCCACTRLIERCLWCTTCSCLLTTLLPRLPLPLLLLPLPHPPSSLHNSLPPLLWRQVHSDDGRAQNGWRNTLAFDPLLPVKGFTYFDALLAPIVDALILALDNSSGPAWLSLQGEMGATGGLSSRLAQALACCCWCS